MARTPRGEAWRCLRCGAYVLGEPRGRGPAEHAPVVLRGEALRDAFVLRILAVDKAVRGFFICLVAVGIWRFGGSRTALRQTFDTYLPLLQPLFDRFGVAVSDLAAVHLIERAFDLRPTTITLIAGGLLLYGLLQLLEATGLWLMKRWGEYVAVVATSLFLPLEIYELVERVTALRVLALVVNLFLVAYLVWTKRLFGVRGGHAAVERQRHATSLLEVERAAAEDSLTKPRTWARPIRHAS